MKRPSAQLVLSAYMQGVFPMAHAEEDGKIYWYAPDPRAIIPLDAFHIPRRLRQYLRKEPFDIRFNTAFKDVILACAQPRPSQPQTWISPGIVDVYCELHSLGFAHSVEAWQDNKLVGGLYGIALGGLFAGESMFHHVTDASKACLVNLVQHLQQQNYRLLDIQFITPHLQQFGAIEIARPQYEQQLEAALSVNCSF